MTAELITDQKVTDSVAHGTDIANLRGDPVAPTIAVDIKMSESESASVPRSSRYLDYLRDFSSYSNIE